MADPDRTSLSRRWWFWILAGLLMFLLGYLIGWLMLYGGRSNPLDDLASTEVTAYLGALCTAVPLW